MKKRSSVWRGGHTAPPVEAGLSVIELVVTVALLSVLLASAYGSFASLQNATTGAGERTLNLAQGRLLMDRSTRDIRSAVRLAGDQSPFALAKGAEVTFYALLDTTGKPTKVHFFVDSQARLVEEVTPADAGSAAPNYTFSTTATVRMVGQYIVNAATNPPFTYFDDAGAPLVLNAGCACLSANDLLSVDAVGVTFSVRHTTALSVAATTLTNRVRLPNVDFNPVSGGA